MVRHVYYVLLITCIALAVVTHIVSVNIQGYHVAATAIDSLQSLIYTLALLFVMYIFDRNRSLSARLWQWGCWCLGSGIYELQKSFMSSTLSYSNYLAILVAFLIGVQWIIIVSGREKRNKLPER
ncbi:hypothetical protein [Alteromonas oceanisediminis]|uniref:hypothetical protein n=1 Tax=Alteromonas oceanisediminis TaxID=2836180 RepID=UPI001BD9E068|nr:hypothetical protein [Alteromonas oceanisediminis]MBT0586177.1 hypothetical protein [Alteromonas oceanisediminis]